jgi:hypothetical protein
MAVHISSALGWRKAQKGSTESGFTKSPAVLNTRSATSILAAYDNSEEAGRSEAGEYIKRTVDVLLLKRTQILQ